MNNLYIQALINNINSGISVSSQLNAMNTVFLKSDYETKAVVSYIAHHHAKEHGFSAPSHIEEFYQNYYCNPKDFNEFYNPYELGFCE